jgi:hypothetical protein
MLDLNFYPDQHLDELEGLSDIEVPQGWTAGQLIRALYEARMKLLSRLLHVDEDGNIAWW